MPEQIFLWYEEYHQSWKKVHNQLDCSKIAMTFQEIILASFEKQTSFDQSDISRNQFLLIMAKVILHKGWHFKLIFADVIQPETDISRLFLLIKTNQTNL